MKKTLTVNLNGKVFNIDEDAYNLLDSYIKNLNDYFKKEEGNSEIIEDFEGRIQELFLEKKPNSDDVITISEVEYIIRVLGNPRDFDIDEEDQKTSNNNEKHKNEEEEIKSNNTSKKLYRNPDDKMISGVCSGLATYLNIDVTIVRIIFILLGFAYGLTIIIYLVLWVLLPEANTARRKLEMKGKPINLKNISDTISESINLANAKLNTTENRGCLSNFLKIILVTLGLIILIPILIVLFVLLTLFIVALFEFFSLYYPGLVTLSIITSLVFLGLPLAYLSYIILAKILHWKALNNGIKATGLIIWIISLIIVIVSFNKIGWEKFKQSDIKDWISGSVTLEGDGNLIEKEFVMDKPLISLVLNNIDLAIEEDSTLNDKNIFIINTDSNIMNYLNIRVKNKNLYISSRKKRHIKRHINLYPSLDNIILKVGKNQFRDIKLNGSSDLTIEDKYTVDNINIKSYGASDISIKDIVSNNISFDIYGASDINVIGNARKCYYNISGSSDIDCDKLLTDSVILDVSGASDIKVYPIKYIGGDVSGASEIKYYNQPKVNKLNMQGVIINN